MYWRSGQYEVLRGRDAKTRNRIVGEALARYGRTSNRRFLLVGAGSVGVVLTAGSRAGQNLMGWHLWSVLGAVGVVFYLYLLWEINGPIRAAVERYVKQREK